MSESPDEPAVETVNKEQLDTGQQTFRLADQTVFGVERTVPLWLTYTTWLAIILFFALLVQTRYMGFLSTVEQMPSGITKQIYIGILGFVGLFAMAVLLYWMWRFAKFLTGYSEWALQYEDGRLWGNLLYFSFQLFFVYILLDPLNRFQAAVLDFKKFTGFRLFFSDKVYYFPYTYDVIVFLLWAIFWAVVISAFWPAVRQFLVGTWHAIQLMYSNGISIMNSLMVTMTHAVSRPAATVRYPEQKREPAPDFRGRPRLKPRPEGGYEFDDWQKYLDACPEGAVHIEWDAATGELEEFLFDTGRCSFTGLSTAGLPDGPLEFVPEYEYASSDRSELVLDLLAEAEARGGE